MKNFFALLLCFSCIYATEVHEMWWEKCLDKDELNKNFGKTWGGDPHQISRVMMRQHVKKMGYTSILDVPCGLAMDYFGFKEDGISIDYLGVDITPKLVALAKERDVPVIEGSIEALPFPDSQYDICYTRHILEHLPSYENPVNELIRVAKKEVFIVFFILPDPFSTKTQIHTDYVKNQFLYHNTYSLSDIEQFLKNNPKVAKFHWENAREDGVILHIFMKPKE